MLMQEILAREVAPGTVAMWWIGQGGYAIKTPTGKVILLDAYLSNYAAQRIDPEFPRRYPAPIDPGQIACDYMICTHDHCDHLDPGAIGPMPDKDSVLFIAPRLCRPRLLELGAPAANIHELNVGDGRRFPDFKIRATFCIPNEECVIDSIGCLISIPDGPTLYFSGDTGYTPFLEYVKGYEPDVVLTCINGRFGNMNAQEAARLTAALKPKLAIPNHYDMFERNLADPEEFRRELSVVAPQIPCKILHVGERLIWPQGADAQSLE